MDLAVNCARHGQYPTKAAALAALAAWRANPRSKVVGTPQPFKCKLGGHWHLGRPRRGKASRRRR